ncbi:MAG: hypothetical protein J6X18_06095 [Bacteroidales bacterium]|nr:hypothetical protein [Bacteroidales bacterium]
MNIITDKEGIFEVDKYDVILLGTSVYDILSHGLQGKVAIRYPHVAEANHKQPYGDLRRLGTRLTVEKEGCPTVSLLYICGYPKKGVKTLDYDALDRCLNTAAMEFKNKRIITTIMGAYSFDGEGDRERILKMMEEAFKGMDVDVYDYPQTCVFNEYMTKARELINMGVSNGKRRTEILKKLYLRN